MFLLDKRVILLLVGVYLAVAQNFIPLVLFLYGLYLSLVHVVVDEDLLLLEVN